MRRKFRLLCTVGCLAVLLFSGYQLYTYWRQNAQSAAVYEELAQYAPVQSSPEAAAVTEQMVWPEVDFDGLETVNSDIIGWLYCADTVIDYPVVQSTDNSYYLDHLFDRSDNPNGCLFVNYRNAGDFSDRHIVIYGHAMKNGSMFSSIRSYAEQDYYNVHPQLLLLTPQARYVVQLFSGYVASVQDDAWQLTFTDDAAFEAWLDDIMRQSAFKSMVQPTHTDHILTLSTCSYDFDDARFVVQGILKSIPK